MANVVKRETSLVYYEVVPCSLGFLLVAATRYGLCAASLGDSAHQMEAELRHDFPSAATRPDTSRLSDWTLQLQKCADGHDVAAALSLPLNVRATQFQERVWTELRSIQSGETRTYTQIAAALGQPSASRAVARACATNPVALAIPCHRVVREDGSLAGYRWGIERKRTLLARECAALFS